MRWVFGPWLAGLLPYRLLGVPGARPVVERNILLWRHAWIALVGGVVEPIVFLLAMGLGLGDLVGTVTGPGGTEVTYGAFVAPGLLAAAAMNAPVYESFNVFAKLHDDRLYQAVLATPVTPREVVVGEVSWSLIRAVLYASGFLVIALAIGLVPSWWGVLVPAATLLIGFAFGGLAMVAVSYLRSWRDFELLLLAVLPMFLLSATFFPIEVYPPRVRWLVLASPLYHGVELVRGLTLGVLRPVLLVHVAVLVALGLVGVRWADRRVTRLMLP